MSDDSWMECQREHVSIVGHAKEQQREENRKASVEAGFLYPPFVAPEDCDKVTPIDESLIETQRLAGMLVRDLQTLSARVEKLQDENAVLKVSLKTARAEVVTCGGEERRIADVLATFYRAPLSMSSVQPLMILAEELNPGLKP